MWQTWLATGLTFAVSASLFVRRKYHLRALLGGRAKKLAELSAEGFHFSKEYDFGSALLLVDQENKQWTLMRTDAPHTARVMKFSDVQGVRMISRQKVSTGPRGLIGGGAIRSSQRGKPEMVTVDTMRGVEISVGGTQAGSIFYVNCLDSDYSAELVEAIFSSFKE